MRRLFLITVAVLFSLATLLPTQRSFVTSAVSDGERLAMFSKPSVVRIIDGVSGTFYFAPPKQNAKNYDVSYVSLGSGFFINASGYIVTNAHVVSTFHDIKTKGEEAGQEVLFYQLLQQVARDYNVNPNNLTRENVLFIKNYSRLTSMKIYHHVIIPDGSVYQFEEKQYGIPAEGKDVAIVKIEVRNTPALLLGDSETVQLQDHVTLLGHPAAADTFNTSILDSKSPLAASITNCKVTARKRSSNGAPLLQVSAATTRGNSGGPVMTAKVEVIGMLTLGGDNVNGQRISGFDSVVPSRTILEFVKAAGVANELGPLDEAYQEGLKLYWDERYSKAIPKFEEVRKLFPEHSEVAQLIESSQQAISEGKEKGLSLTTRSGGGSSVNGNSSMIGYVRKEHLSGGCRCTYFFRNDRTHPIYSDDFGTDIWVNIDGQDVKLKLVNSISSPKGEVAKGQRTSSTYVAPGVTVRIATVVTKGASEEQEGSDYIGTITVIKGGREQTVKIAGSCGC